MEVLGVLLVLAIPMVFIWMWVRVVSYSGRLEELQRRSEEQTELVRALTRRVYQLETGVALPRESAPDAAAVTVAEPASGEPLPQPQPDPLPEPEPAPLPLPEPIPTVEPSTLPEPEMEPEGVFVSPAMEQAPAPKRDWEAVVGGSWLNAVGVLILVVGISLFLGFALTQFGPWGKIGIGAGVSVVMVLAGIFVERQERYATAGRGLIAGGWAALYFTAYAAHGLPAARVIESPFVGGMLLLLVACGMIGHSLRYRSQTLTILAYASAYAALILGPASGFSIAASVPLTVSLLAVARAMDWRLTPIAGMVFTYWTFAFRFNSNEISSALGAAALIVYWLCFELYDLFKQRAVYRDVIPNGSLFLLNGVLFFGTAFMVLPQGMRVEAAHFLTIMGALFLASAVVRLHWGVMAEDRGGGSSYLPEPEQLGIGVAAVLFAFSILRRFDSPVVAQVGLLLEAQLLVLAGLYFRMPLLRHLAAVLFGFTAVLLPARSHEFHRNWIPFGFAMPALFYINRWITKEGRYYTWGALPLLLPAILEAAGDIWAGVWMALAIVVLAELHAWSGWREFRQQAAVVMVVVTLGTLLGVDQWRPIALTAALLYVAALRHRGDPLVRDLGSLAGLATAGCAMYYGLPSAWVGPGWGLLALVTLEAGLWLDARRMQWQAHGMAVAAFGHLFLTNFTLNDDSARISLRVLTVFPMIALAWHAWRRTPEVLVARLYCWLMAFVAAVLLRFELGASLVVVGWAALMLLLLAFGLRRGLPDLQFQAYLLALAMFLHAAAYNFAVNQALFGMSERLVAGIAAIAAFHIAQFLLPREELYARPGYAMLGTALLSILLFFEISGALLTIAWGIQAAAVLVAGFAARERVMRFAGLFLFLVCTLKLFLYDLRNLDTMSRILSFIVLGLVLMGASTLYMRFREKIQRYF